MMSSPEMFYENNIKDKYEKEIMSIIRRLKREIGALKNKIEHPDYKNREFLIEPSETTQISVLREYLDLAINEIKDVYIPSNAEQKSIIFDKNIPYINKIVFTQGIHIGPSQTKTVIINDDNNDFLESIKELHLGEWRRKYSLDRFGIYVLDGEFWSLEIYYSNKARAVKFYGDNAYPYNFDRLVDIFNKTRTLGD